MDRGSWMVILRVTVGPVGDKTLRRTIASAVTHELLSKNPSRFSQWGFKEEPLINPIRVEYERERKTLEKYTTDYFITKVTGQYAVQKPRCRK